MSEQMKWAQRWSVNEDGEMVMDDHGSWVENAYYEYLKADYAVLKTDAQLVVKHLGEACAENTRLKAEVERLTAEVNYRKNMDTHIKIMADQYTPAKEGKPSV